MNSTAFFSTRTLWMAVCFLLPVTFSDTVLAADFPTKPPDNPEFKEIEWDQISVQDVSDYGKQALAIDPAKWRHAETPNYILHFRRVTEARKVARELEFNLWFVARTLGASTDLSARKGRAYIFEDQSEWMAFLTTSDLPVWSASLAVGDELFLNVRSAGDAGRFDSYTLAHEATHAVVARLYPNRPWPLWLNEGFAEAMAAEGVAARKNQTVGRHQQKLQFNQLGPEELAMITVYPDTSEERTKLYQSSEFVVRFLLSEFPREKFHLLVDEILDGKSTSDAAIIAYPEQVESPGDFQLKYDRFKR